MARKVAVKKKTAKAPKKAVAKKAPGRKPATRATAKKAAAPSKPIRVSAPAGKTISASALLQAVADHLGIKKTEAKGFVDGYLDVVKAHVVKGVKVKVGDVGMLQIRHRKARMGRNPATGEPVKIKASKKIAFRPSATMKEMVR